LLLAKRPFASCNACNIAELSIPTLALESASITFCIWQSDTLVAVFVCVIFLEAGGSLPYFKNSSAHAGDPLTTMLLFWTFAVLLEHSDMLAVTCFIFRFNFNLFFNVCVAVLRAPPFPNIAFMNATGPLFSAIDSEKVFFLFWTFLQKSVPLIFLTSFVLPLQLLLLSSEQISNLEPYDICLYKTKKK